MGLHVKQSLMVRSAGSWHWRQGTGSCWMPPDFFWADLYLSGEDLAEFLM
jgi:hypothetical protein